MSQQSQKLAGLLSRVARYSVFLGIGGSAVQASLYTGGPPDQALLLSLCDLLITTQASDTCLQLTVGRGQ